MPRVSRPGFVINYEAAGDPGGRPIVLIAGLGEQIGSVEFPDEHCRLLVDAGFRVIRIDNRDCGLSTPDPELPARSVMATLAAAQAGAAPAPDYTLADMADDVAAVLDDLRLAGTDVVGASLGGFIARWVALRHPARVRTLTIVMSGSGAGPTDPGGQIEPAALAELVAMSVRRSRPDAIEHLIGAWRWLWGPTFHFDEAWIRDRVAYAFDRAYRPEGIARAMIAAIMTPGVWDTQRAIACPTLVMHGDADPIFALDHARQVNERIAGSRLWTARGMGHAMPRELWPEMVERIAALAAP